MKKVCNVKVCTESLLMLTLICSHLFLFSLLLVSSHMSAVRDLFAHHGNNNTHNLMMHEYNLEGFRGYGAKMDDK